MVDAAGTEVWGDLNIDTKAGLLTVTIPQAFLDKAVYPVRHAAGLEFGLHTEGGTGNERSIQMLFININLPTSNGAMTSVTIYGSYWNSGATFNPALYSDVAGVPTTRLAYLDSGGTAMPASAAWTTTDLSYNNIVSGTTYWLGFKGQDSSHHLAYYYDTGYTNVCCFDTSYGGWANPWPTSYFIDRRGSIYATYTAAGTDYSLSVASGAFTEGGTAAGLRRTAKVSPASGIFAEHGTVVGLRKTSKVVPSSGAYSEHGTAASLRRTAKVSPASGVFVETGTAVGLRKTSKIVPASGIFNAGGTAVGLRRTAKIIPISGVFTEHGTAVGLLRKGKISLASGTFHEVGYDATLTLAAALIKLETFRIIGRVRLP